MERKAQTSEEKDIILCRCEEVIQKTIEEAIGKGGDTLDSVKRSTRAGMGLCQGRTCQRLVAKILRDKTGKPLEALTPPASRPPFRPIKLDLLAQEGNKTEERE